MKLELGHTFYSSTPQPHAPVWASLDLAAFSVIGATILGWLPNIAAVLSIIYLGLQIAVTWRNLRKVKNSE